MHATFFQSQFDKQQAPFPQQSKEPQIISINIVNILLFMAQFELMQARRG